ncbi:MAG: L-rhamnonate dehydratase [Spirochaetaceae bacterium]|nr:MAG: L-rhamnonate dehydratase [Spirochaetaceae bacterium]
MAEFAFRIRLPVSSQPFHVKPCPHVTASPQIAQSAVSLQREATPHIVDRQARCLVKIADISVVQVSLPDSRRKTESRRASWAQDAEVANPMSWYPKVKRHRSLWLPAWEGAWVKATAEDGTYGLGPLDSAPVVTAVVTHLAEHLVGEECMAVERAADMMFRLTKPYGTVGLASHAISGIDLALWDLKGKLLDRPVYSLLGGPQKDRIFCYATGNDYDWYKELGFRAFKLACPYGPADGLDGLLRNEAFVARAREIVGDDSELMLDCWMAFDVEYAVRLAKILRPYRLNWMEECLIPEDLDAHVALRQRLPWQTLATGEHWYTHVPFQWAVRHRVADILQPDISWCGGLTTAQRIAATADSGGVQVILHGGGNTPFGQHFTYATRASRWCECFVSAPPGVPPEESARLPGQTIPRDGWIVPSDGPGFGLDIPPHWITR